jgi:hypothetical protein
MFLVRGRTNVAIPFYGIGVFMPIMAMGLAIRRHVLSHYTGRRRRWGSRAAAFSVGLTVIVFFGQLVGKWNEGGWVALLAFSLLAVAAHLILLSPLGFRDPEQIHRIVREKARVEGGMASIVEWQALKMQEYRYSLIGRITLLSARFFELFGVVRPMRYGGPPPVAAGDYDHALHVDDPGAPSLLEPYLKKPDFEPDVTEEMEEEAAEDETVET